MAQTVSDFVWARLHEWGISRVFGYPGDGAGGLDVAIERARDFMHYVQVRHEEMAAFMASAHAKFTGEVGLCYATSGPGATHLLTGLYDAKGDHVPVVAICGQQARFALGTHFQQELDLQTLFSDVSEYVVTATVPGQVRACIDRAVRIAQAKRAVCTVIIPNDLQLMAYEELPTEHGATHTGVGFPGTAKVPDRAIGVSRPVTLASVLDGTSNTAAFSERVKGIGDGGALQDTMAVDPNKPSSRPYQLDNKTDSDNGPQTYYNACKVLNAQTATPAAVGVLLLGDTIRSGWSIAAALGVVLSGAGATALARFEGVAA